MTFYCSWDPELRLDICSPARAFGHPWPSEEVLQGGGGWHQWGPKAREELQMSSLSYGKNFMLVNMTETKNNIYACTFRGKCLESAIYFISKFCFTLCKWQCKYSRTYLERPLPWETTCLDRPHIFDRKTYISIQLNLSPEITCLDRPHFCGQWGGLSRQVLLYLRWKEFCMSCIQSVTNMSSGV